MKDIDIGTVIPEKQEQPFFYPVPATQNGRRALKTLESLRAGQPAPEMMLATSPVAQSAVNHIRQRMYGRIPIMRIVVGAMGSGKTTFLKNLSKIARDSGSIPIRHTATTTGRLPINELTLLLLGNHEILALALERARKAAQENDSEVLRHIQSTIHHSRQNTGSYALSCLLQHIIDPVMSQEPTGDLASQYLGAISKWLQANLRTELISFIKEVSDEPIAGMGDYQQDYCIPLIRAHFMLYSLSGAYPLWLIDEFESYIALNEKNKDKTLGFIRDVLDTLTEESDRFDDGGFGIVLFTTPDGKRMMQGYPALADRVRGSQKFTVSSPTWQTKDLSDWDTGLMMEYLSTLFEQAASIDPEVSGKIAEQLKIDRHDPDFIEVTTAVLSDHEIEPRNRIKTLICDLLDLIPEQTKANDEYQEAKASVLAMLCELDEEAPGSVSDTDTPAPYSEECDHTDDKEHGSPVEAESEAPELMEPVESSDLGSLVCEEGEEENATPTYQNAEMMIDRLANAEVELEIEEDDFKLPEPFEPDEDDNEISGNTTKEVKDSPLSMVLTENVWQEEINKLWEDDHSLSSEFSSPTPSTIQTFLGLTQLDFSYQRGQITTLNVSKVIENRLPSAMATNLTALLDDGYGAAELHDAIKLNQNFALYLKPDQIFDVECRLENIIHSYGLAMPVRVPINKKMVEEIENHIRKELKTDDEIIKLTIQMLQARALCKNETLTQDSTVHWYPSQSSRKDIQSTVKNYFLDIFENEMKPVIIREMERGDRTLRTFDNIVKSNSLFRAKSLSLPVWYHYQETIGSLRHFALTYMAEAGVIIDLAELDKWVLEKYKELSGKDETPPTSRKGIFFYSPKKSWLKTKQEQQRLHDQPIHEPFNGSP